MVQMAWLFVICCIISQTAAGYNVSPACVCHPTVGVMSPLSWLKLSLMHGEICSIIYTPTHPPTHPPTHTHTHTHTHRIHTYTHWKHKVVKGGAKSTFSLKGCQRTSKISWQLSAKMVVMENRVISDNLMTNLRTFYFVCSAKQAPSLTTFCLYYTRLHACMHACMYTHASARRNTQTFTYFVDASLLWYLYMQKGCSKW